MGLKRRWLAAGALALAAGLAVPGAARAAPPAVVTGGVSALTFSTALLHGTVNPEGHATTYFFQYGATSLYGSQTPAGNAGAGSARVAVTGPVGGLVPNTVYHYRLVAQDGGTIVKGRDRTLRTKVQPLGLTAFAAVPDPVTFGSTLTISGALGGTNKGSRTVVLQERAFPYTAAWQPAANPQLTNDQGGFAFPIVALPVTTQFQVYDQGKPSVASAIATVGVAYRISGRSSTRHVKRGRSILFSGTMRPGLSGVQVRIQRQHSGRWSTITHTLSRHRPGATDGKFSKHVRIRRGGSYRVEAVGAGAYVSGSSVPFTIRTHR
jgi:hypothetical protein